MAVKRTHKKPAIPKEAKEGEKVATLLIETLKAPGAPKASALGYVTGVSFLMKALIDLAAQQGEDREALKQQAIKNIMIM